MYDRTSPLPLALTQGRPAARALLRGDEAHPDLLGEVLLYPWQGGSLVLTRLTGLPGDGLYPLHIHAAGACQTGGDVPFHCAGPFYPPGLAALAPVLSSGGTALSLHYSRRFTPEQVLGRSLVLHGRGAAGGRIACGVIRRA